MATKNPAADLAGALDGQTVGGVALTLGTNLFIGPMRPDDSTPSPCVFVLNSGGASPVPYLGGNRQAWYRPTVQVQVRGAPSSFQAGETLARGVLEYLELYALTGYVGVYARDSQPAYLGEDGVGRPLWSLNVEAQYVG